MREAAHEVSRPVIFGVLIIIAVYLPVLTLQSLEGRMFRPMAVTVVSALAGSLLLALFVVPTFAPSRFVTGPMLTETARDRVHVLAPKTRYNNPGSTVCALVTEGLSIA